MTPRLSGKSERLKRSVVRLSFTNDIKALDLLMAPEIYRDL